MYVILTSKPGQFRTELDEHLHSVEAYDYMFYGRKRARFVIAQLTGETKVRIVEEGEPDDGPATINLVPSKFLPRFDSLELARQELHELARFGNTQATLVRC